MMVAVGIDSTEIERFVSWALWPRQRLRRIFSDVEIDYCLSIAGLEAQRFAARFAVREAFFKALCSLDTKNRVPFLRVCSCLSLVHAHNGAPQLLVNWQTLEPTYARRDELSMNIAVSLTHTRANATAIVIISHTKNSQP